jgi:4-carboxymuconolactone decarboxylase
VGGEVGGEAGGEPRLAPLLREQLDAEQLAMWDALAAGPRGARAVREEGFLTGPFDALLRSPQVGAAVAGLGGLLRFDSSLDPRHRELAIITVAARWRARYAWLRHDVYAREAGVPQEAIDAIAEDRTPSFERADDRAVHDLVHQLAHTGAVDDEAYAAALAQIGERGLVDLVALAGYYCITSFVLNTFRVPLPPGDRVPWDPA